MTKRCGFYVKDGVLCRKDVYIQWDLGFDKEAKQLYIERIIWELGKGFETAIDVTTASPIHEARMLSPFFVKVGEESVEDAWAEVKEVNPVVKKIPGTFDYLYLSSLTGEQKQYVLRNKVFIDVFHNPDKAYNTQAKSLAVYQLLVEQKRVALLQDLDGFLKWYIENCHTVKVEQEAL